uniref:Chemokine interleukin-8-like domain-containing protein n=1 Tax=Echeneis naucrates TaxID=173247 RepID=A0A665UJX6_ECHNA
LNPLLSTTEDEGQYCHPVLCSAGLRALIPHCQCVKLYKSVKNPSNISRVLVIKPLEAVDLKKIDLLCLDPKEKFTQAILYVW